MQDSSGVRERQKLRALCLQKCGGRQIRQITIRRSQKLLQTISAYMDQKDTQLHSNCPLGHGGIGRRRDWESEELGEGRVGRGRHWEKI
eukprot:2884387-Pyramimonas_sp.AAC.1